jgi:hypothetical protein
MPPGFLDIIRANPPSEKDRATILSIDIATASHRERKAGDARRDSKVAHRALYQSQVSGPGLHPRPKNFGPLNQAQAGAIFINTSTIEHRSQTP